MSTRGLDILPWGRVPTHHDTIAVVSRSMSMTASASSNITKMSHIMMVIYTNTNIS